MSSSLLCCTHHNVRHASSSSRHASVPGTIAMWPMYNLERPSRGCMECQDLLNIWTQQICETYHGMDKVDLNSQSMCFLRAWTIMSARSSMTLARGWAWSQKASGKLCPHQHAYLGSIKFLHHALQVRWKAWGVQNHRCSTWSIAVHKGTGRNPVLVCSGRMQREAPNNFLNTHFFLSNFPKEQETSTCWQGFEVKGPGISRCRWFFFSCCIC